MWIAKWFLSTQIRPISYYWTDSLEYVLCPRTFRTTLVCTGKPIDTYITGIQESLLFPEFWVSNIPQYFCFALSSAYTPLKSHISGFNILCILRSAKNCTRENIDPTFDHKIAKFDTRENFRLYGITVNF